MFLGFLATISALTTAVKQTVPICSQGTLEYTSSPGAKSVTFKPFFKTIPAKSKPKVAKEVEEKPKKVAPKKTAAWQKKEKAKDEPIVMVETKAAKKKSTK